MGTVKSKSLERILLIVATLMALTAPCLAQGKRVWVLRSPGQMIEYDLSTFAVKQTVKVPEEAVQAPANIAVNREGQILYAPTISLPLSDEDISTPPKAWFWNGHSAMTIALGVKHEIQATGSNQAVMELAPAVYLSADGEHLLWFANRERRLVRDGLDLSTTTSWQAWQTDLSGSGREELVAVNFPECRCETGACEEHCPVGVVWTPEPGVGKFILMTQFVAGQTAPEYKASMRYREEGGKWTGESLPAALERVLDAAPDGSVIVEAIPDTGCCGWANQSDDQTLVLGNGKKLTVFDELESYKNSDYDVSFFTSNAKLSPALGSVAMTIVSTAQPNKPIQLAEQGDANPEESQRIRKALTELPAVEVKSLEDSSRRVTRVPHATLVGWINEKELLIVEDRVLVVYNVATGARRKSSVRVEDAGRVFLR